MATYEDVLEFLGSGDATVEQLTEIRNAINAALPQGEDLYWVVEGDPQSIQLGDETFCLVRRGRAQLDQINRLREWLRVYAKPAIEKAYPQGNEDVKNAGIAEGIELVIGLLDADALVELGCILLLKDKEFVEEHFDISWIIDAIGRVVKFQPAFNKLIQGFFGKRG